MTIHSPKVALVQDGARGHYGLARALQTSGVLQAMYTDFFIRRGSGLDRLSPLLRKFSNVNLRRLLDRRCDELDPRLIHTNFLMRLRQDRRRKSFVDDASYFRWQAADTARWIAADLFRNSSRPAANILTGFIRNLDPDLCRLSQSRGLKTVGDQMIAPAFIEQREIKIQLERFPGWETIPRDEYSKWIDIENQTWTALDAVTCPSDYVASGLREAGIPSGRIHVINYPIDESHFQFVDRSGPRDVITVGFVGQVRLRKGAPYFLEVARRFPRDRVRFVMIGPHFLTDSAIGQLREHVHVEVAPRSEVPRRLASFDLIYFPTTCEGSAYALMEAMASGLPIVTSPNSGTVARHTIEAFLCPYDDLDAATGYIDRLVRDRDLRLTMGRAAAERYRLFNQQKYTADFAALMNQLVQGGQPEGRGAPDPVSLKP